MKKLFLIAAVILCGTGFVMAGENVIVPSAANSNPIPAADYGGVEIATMSFSSGPLCIVCVTSPTLANIALSGVVYGVIFSSQTGTVDYVDFFDTNTALTGGVQPGTKQNFLRVYTDTSATNNSGFGGTIRLLQWPIRFSTGLQAQGSANLTSYNNVDILYWRRKK